MSTIARKNVRRDGGLSSDTALGFVGCSLAAASATFGIVMTVHGPPSDFGKRRDFTGFAQLAPRVQGPEPSIRRLEDLDFTATASIPKRGTSPSQRAAALSVTLQDASVDAATIRIGGRSSIVHVGDIIPGMGRILAILPGAAPMLRTEGGLIVAAKDR